MLLSGRRLNRGSVPLSSTRSTLHLTHDLFRHDMVDAGILVWHAGRAPLESVVHLAYLSDHPVAPAKPVDQHARCGVILKGGHLNIFRAIDNKYWASDKGNNSTGIPT